MPKWKERLDRWADKVDAQRANLISFLIVLRYVHMWGLEARGPVVVHVKRQRR